MKSEVIRVSIIEDIAEERALYARIVDEAGDMQCVSAHPNTTHALRHLPSLKPDVALVDIVMPRGSISGIECLRQLKARVPVVIPVILTKFNNDDFIFDSLSAGALGYLLKRDVRENLPTRIRQAYNGEVVMTPEIARRVLLHFQKHDAKAAAEKVNLTAREEEVLRLIAQGLTSKQIAFRLSCSPNTVDRHAQNICQKLQVSGRVAAASRYFGKGFDDR